MKNLILWFAMLLPTLSFAQLPNYPPVDLPYDSITNLICFKKVIKHDSLSAQKLFEIATSYLKSGKNNFLVIDQDMMESWAMGRYKWAHDSKVPKLGFDRYDSLTNTVIGHCVFMFQGEVWDCIHLFILKGDVLINCKDGKSRIEVTNLKYSHYNSSGVPRRWAIKSDNEKGDCDWEGALEDLKRCEPCEQTTNHLYAYISKCARQIIINYKSYIKQTEQKTEDNW